MNIIKTANKIRKGLVATDTRKQKMMCFDTAVYQTQI